MRRWQLLFLLAAACAPAAHAQFELFRVSGNVELAVTSLYDFGPIYAGESAATHFRLRNTTASPAVLAVLNAAGAGFTLTGPATPASVAPAAAVDFTVTFAATTVGSYSANLEITGLSTLLTASVAPSLTYTVILPGGRISLSATPVDFGSVAAGSQNTLHFTAANQTVVPLLVPAITLPAGPFALSGASPSGTLLLPQQQAAFDVVFAPLTSGTFTAGLTLGDRTYPLTAISPAPPLPSPTLTIDLPRNQSAQQGSITVQFDGPAAVSGAGTVTLDLQPAAGTGNDSAIAFAAGGRVAAFTFQPGDTQARFGSQAAALFQTGTTAGTLVFTAALGTNSIRQSLTISPALVSLSSVQAARDPSNLQVQVVGYDNSRTVGPLIFTFFDAAGNPIQPGGIQSDNQASFLNYYSASDLGGVFLLTAHFPVNGDTSLVRSVEVQLINSTGTTKSNRTSF
ncbi:MAG TPA: choice-of-anchor D domain-containing protein [Candidatus Sulfopaludibacter sp.]|jgi:hypothetical protein|nr:choice-of-anchor D domain-containing protein [Candidatus Sulfopaludibacter sp.]